MNPLNRQNKQTGLKVLAVALGMFALAFASFPLYNLFCKVTGYGGAPITLDVQPSTKQGQRRITVSFNGDVMTDVPWRFVPVQREVTVLTGENTLIFFEAENLSDTPITGVATFNVTPDKASMYFNKIQCFCFDRQTLAPRQKVQMPVSFYIDPAIETDNSMVDVQNMTLSYTFFHAKE